LQSVFFNEFSTVCCCSRVGRSSEPSAVFSCTQGISWSRSWRSEQSLDDPRVLAARGRRGLELQGTARETTIGPPKIATSSTTPHSFYHGNYTTANFMTTCSITPRRFAGHGNYEVIFMTQGVDTPPQKWRRSTHSASDSTTTAISGMLRGVAFKTAFPGGARKIMSSKFVVAASGKPSHSGTISHTYWGSSFHGASIRTEGSRVLG
jgi:hypothetical protein